MRGRSFYKLFLFIVPLVLVALVSLNNSTSFAQDGGRFEENLTFKDLMEAFAADQLPPESSSALALTPCSGGFAGSYPCSNVDLMAFMPLSAIGGGSGNDIWGWTDSQTGREYAIMGRTSGTSFVDITDAENPIYLGNLPTHTTNSSWRDVKVHADHAFVVSEASGHGMQIFDLTQLRNVPSPPVTFSNTAHYSGFGNAHNIVINEDSGYAYGVGTSTCSGGLHMVNIQNPTSPSNAGCFSSDGYTHDAQCVNYTGPDSAYQGREICFNSNEDTLTIVDVTNKSNPVQLSRTGYSGSRYTHQGWLTDDQAHFLLDDELDEQNNGHNTRTYIWDVSDLNAPNLTGNYTSAESAIDHNLYIQGNYAYQANYRAGLRILDVASVASGSLTEVAYFDVYPANNNPSFNGAWSNYPYFASGNVIISGIEQGLFIVRPNLGPPPPTPTPGPTDTPAPPTPTPLPQACTTYSSADTPISLPNGTTSISSNISVPTSGTITDVNVSVDMPHAWVGDIGFEVSHSGADVTVIDRPGVPASTYGCSGDDINATLDDSAGTAVEGVCAGGTPTINGTFSPNQALSAFNGQSSNGTWTLTVTDYYVSADAGSLNSWSVEICVEDTGSPTNTPVPPTATNVPPTATSVPPTATNVPPTATNVPPTATNVPPTATNVPPTATNVPPTATNIPPTATSVPPTATPPPSGGDVIYVSSTSGGNVGGVSFADEDIMEYDTASDTWAMYFDGSDVGLSGSGARDVDAFTLLSDGTILMSFSGATTIPDAGSVDDSDIVQFTPTSLGTSTAGTFALFFDGSDVGLSSNGEDIDAIGVAPDGRLIISTIGSHSVTGASGNDEDFLIFTATAFGATTSGTWETYFDGSDVGLGGVSTEDVYGGWVDASGNIYLTTRGTYNVTGLSGDGDDIFVCSPGSTGTTTTCTFSAFWDGDAFGYGAEIMDGLFIMR